MASTARQSPSSVDSFINANFLAIHQFLQSIQKETTSLGARRNKFVSTFIFNSINFNTNRSMKDHKFKHLWQIS